MTASLFVRGATFKRAPFVFEGGHIVIIRGNLFFNFHGVHNGLYINHVPSMLHSTDFDHTVYINIMYV